MSLAQTGASVGFSGEVLFSSVLEGLPGTLKEVLLEHGPADPGVLRAYLRTSIAQLGLLPSPGVTEEQFDDYSGYVWWWFLVCKADVDA